MSITNGQLANATNFNAAFASKSADNTLAGDQIFSGSISTTTADVATSATIAALSSTTSAVRMTGSTTTTIQGIAAGTSGQYITILNVSSAVVTLAHQNGSATAANRMILPNAANVDIAANSAAELMYDATQARWVIKSGSGGSAGGGASLQWISDANAPLYSFENSSRVYSFESALGQLLYATVKVPKSYSAGNQISLRMVYYNADTSGTALISSVATLVRTGTDLMSSTTNQRTSTNAAVTMSGATQNIPQALILDLSSSTGQINSVSVAAGDIIKIYITRGTDSATSDIKVPAYGAEVTFTT